MFPVSIEGTLYAEYVGADLSADLWPLLRMRIEERGGSITLQTDGGLTFTNPVWQSILRGNWSLFVFVTAGEIRVREHGSHLQFRYAFLMRRLLLQGSILALCAVASGVPEAILAVAALWALNYSISWARLSGAVPRWLGETPGLFLRPAPPAV